MIQNSPASTHNEDDDTGTITTTTTTPLRMITTATAKKRPRSRDTVDDGKHDTNDDNDNINPIVNPNQNRRRTDTKKGPDVYHIAYHQYQYEPLYFTYDKLVSSSSSSSLLSKLRYHHLYPPKVSLPTRIGMTQDHDAVVANVTTSPSSPPPGTPLCYYKASYLMTYRNSNETVIPLPPNHHDPPHPPQHHQLEQSMDSDGTVTEIVTADIIIHQHVNGLCVICVANIETILQQYPQLQPPPPPLVHDDTRSSSNTTGSWAQFQYQVQVTSSELSLAQKRKRNTKQLQGKKNHNNNNNTIRTNNTEADHNKNCMDGLVQPSDTLATLWIVPTSSSSVQNSSRPPTDHTTTTTNNICIRFPCGVMGSIIELNEKFLSSNLMSNNNNNNNSSSHHHDHARNSHDTLQLLQSDPYLKGYLAIILPSGPFPPPSELTNRIDQVTVV